MAARDLHTPINGAGVSSPSTELLLFPLGRAQGAILLTPRKVHLPDLCLTAVSTDSFGPSVSLGAEDKVHYWTIVICEVLDIVMAGRLTTGSGKLKL
jgi:hypothetical protein